jgi:hypothetical protein
MRLVQQSSTRTTFSALSQWYSIIVVTLFGFFFMLLGLSLILTKAAIIPGMLLCGGFLIVGVGGIWALTYDVIVALTFDTIARRVYLYKLFPPGSHRYSYQEIKNVEIEEEWNSEVGQTTYRVCLVHQSGLRLILTRFQPNEQWSQQTAERIVTLLQG